MVPSWVLNAFIIFVAGILACYIGSTLPWYDMFGAYITGFVIICTVCAITNNFPMLMALGLWMPFAFPIPGLAGFPTFAIVLGWVGLIIFFRTCLTGSIRYIPSYNVFLLIAFSWVPIRFLMNPIHKLGAGVSGGIGVSGAMPYFLYVLAVTTLVTLGAILNTREKLIRFLRWSFLFAFLIGMMFFICAFIPSTAPFFIAMGSFQAGNMGDGIQRFVQLPGYGLFLIEVALCRDLFRLNRIQSLVLFLLGMAMLIIGGNRSTVAAALIAVPVILLLRRRTHALLLSGLLVFVGVGVLRVSVNDVSSNEISPLVRSLGIFDSKIDAASGGDASAAWRYSVWQSGIDKIMEHPLTGKGFGNLPQHLDTTLKGTSSSTDFEAVLAGGEAHNGFITAAYGFGIPFVLLLTAIIIVRLFSHMRSALMTDKHDRELRDLHAFLACMMATYLMHIYTAFDISVVSLWVYVGMGIILDHLSRPSPTADHSSTLQQNIQPTSEEPIKLVLSRSVS